jgi:hypothetical protein
VEDQPRSAAPGFDGGNSPPKLGICDQPQIILDPLVLVCRLADGSTPRQ